MIFDEEFLESLPEDPHNAILSICEEFMNNWHNDEIRTVDLVLESFALISTYSKSINLRLEFPEVNDSRGSATSQIDF